MKRMQRMQKQELWGAATRDSRGGAPKLLPQYPLHPLHSIKLSVPDPCLERPACAILAGSCCTEY